MFTDNFERFGVTADCNKVLPGMVYVDLQEGKSRKEIYHAYNNGASVIFTTQNISNPELPVVKVKNVSETMLLLLDKYFHNPQNKVKLVAVSGSNDKSTVLDLLYKILEKKSTKIKAEDEKDFIKYFSSIKDMNIEDIYEYMDRVDPAGEHYLPVIVDYRLKYFRFMNGFKFDCAIVTGVDSLDAGDGKYELGSIRSFLSQIQENKPIILNVDDDMVLKALDASKDTIVITYGLNKRAAVTATSIDVNQQTTFNYCLQRSMVTRGGNVLEPFEMPVSINILGSSSIHDALAVITCALYYDMDMEQIKAALMSYVSPSRRFELTDVKGITVLDNYCSSAGELDKTLEGLQLLNYNNLVLMLSICKAEEETDIDTYIKVLKQWNGILKISEVVLCGCIDINNGIKPLSINEIRKMKKALSESLNIKYFDGLKAAVEHVGEFVKSGDMLIMAGSDEMNSGKQLLVQQLSSRSKH